jgi:hypothetical protein
MITRLQAIYQDFANLQQLTKEVSPTTYRMKDT